MDTAQIIKVAEAFAEHTNLKLSTIGNYSVNDGKIFDRWKKGGSCTLVTATTMLRWFSERWPEDLTWPKDIKRPEKRKDAA